MCWYLLSRLILKLLGDNSVDSSDEEALEAQSCFKALSEAKTEEAEEWQAAS